MEDDGKKGKTKSVEPLTKKQELNNHVVLMRKVVRKARVHLINKLTKEVKKLKDRKGDAQAQEKAKRKAERLLQEIQVIKHLKEDKVSIFALQDKTKLEDILQNIQSASESRALSRLGHHQFVQKQVEQYRTSNPYWELQIPVLLEKSKDKRRKINQKLAEREAAKLIGNKSKAKSASPTRKSEGEGDLTSESESESGIGEESDQDQEDTHPEEPERVIPEKVIKEKASKQQKQKKTIPNNSNSKLKTQKLQKSQQKQNPHRDISKSEGTIRVTFLKNLEDLEKDQPNKSVGTTTTTPEIKLAVDDLSKVKKLLPKSSFFVGGVDEEVREPIVPSTRGRGKDQPPNRNNWNQNQHQNPEKEFKPIFRKGKLVNKPGPKGFRPERPERNSKPQRYFNNFDQGSSNLIPLGDKSLCKPEFPHSKAPQITGAAPAEKLHPSWEAKKRQQPTLSEFKGKKIKFDD